MTFRCLWLARELPFPEDSGDRLYSSRMAQALAAAGADVTFTGLIHDHSAADGPAPVRWHGVGGGPRATWRALLSTQPLQSARPATMAYARVVRSLLRERWDAVVLDHYGSAWLLPLMRLARAGIDRQPVIAHVSHNHETSLWRDMAQRFVGPAWKRLGLQQNALKVAYAEDRLVRGVDLLSCITDEDASAYADDGVDTPSIVLPPGYAGTRLEARQVSAATPRHVVLVGAFRWVVKQDNLRALVRHAADAFAQHGIVLDVVGDVPEPLRRELAPHAAVRLHGFVDDLQPLLANARMALVPEAIGGGFKLKLLDYVFHRVPVVTLSDAAAGLPATLRAAMRECPDLPALVAAVVQGIDDVDALDRMQQAAFDAAQLSFDWGDRGRLLLASLQAQALAAPRSLGDGLEIGQAHSSRYSNAQFSADSRYPPMTSQPMNSTTRTEVGAAIRVRQ